MIVALAFVPDEKVKIEYEKLTDYFLNIDAGFEIINFLLWFEENYLKNSIYLFEDENKKKYFSWNVNCNVKEKFNKTLNSFEGCTEH
jgi:hypothetical protein